MKLIKLLAKLLQMQTHYSIYPNFQPPIHLKIKYEPKLDNSKLPKLWDVGTNTIVLDWNNYKTFQSLERQSDKKQFFASIPQINTAGCFFPFEVQLPLLIHEATLSE